MLRLRLAPIISKNWRVPIHNR